MVDTMQIERITRELLAAIGEDPNREGITGTPHRVAKMWQEFVEYDPGNTDTVFECVQADQMVVVSGVRVYSLCEHHLLPFWCDVTMAYIPKQTVLGLSKFARIAHLHAHKLQLQERLVNDIADDLQRLTQTPDVAVIAHGMHLCMAMRGIRTEAVMTCSAMRGAFRDEASTREEFLRLSGGKK